MRCKRFSSTYNAGYRIGMIVAGAGLYFLLLIWELPKAIISHEVWKYTYLTMAAVMAVGIITTLCIREPQVNRIYKHYKTTDYYRLVFCVFIAVATFVVSYIYSGNLTYAIVKAAKLKTPQLYLV